MKYTMKTKMIIEATLDGSEMMTATKGGKHSILLSDIDPDTFENINEIEITFQLHRNEQGRFDHIWKEALNHKQSEGHTE